MASVTAEIPQTRPPGETDRPAPATFDDLVRLHQPRVARLAQRLLGWPAEVEDVVQEVFVAAWKSFSSFRGESSPETWLMRITINQCRRHNRRRLFRLAFLRRAAEQQRRAVEASDAPAEAERFDRVRQSVRQLPARYREVIVLRYLEQMDVPEIMKVLTLSRSAVDVRLHRGRELLKESLAEWVNA